MIDLISLPIELQEIILGKLTGRNLLNLSKVCLLWENLCERILKKKYTKVIPKECIKEIESSIKTKNIWLTAINYHYTQLDLIRNTYNHINTISLEFCGNHRMCFCVFGPLVIIGCKSGEIKLYNLEESITPVEIIKTLNQPILDVKIMPLKNILLVKTDKKSLEFFSLPNICDKFWVHKICRLKIIFQDYLDNINCDGTFSIYNSLLAIVTSPNELKVYQVDKLDNNKVFLKLFRNFVTEKKIGTISIWDNEIIVLCKSGEIICWWFHTQISFASDKYLEICYENPVWIFRNTIFCSSMISSQLLEYWHMNRGSDCWLIGRPCSDLVRCRNLGSVSDSVNNSEYVLCLSIIQRLLACGTKDGKIFLYYLSSQCLSAENSNEKGNNHWENEFSRGPDLIIKTKENPINSIQIQLCENCVKIYTWSYVSSKNTELKGFFQCIILKQEN